MKYFKIYDIIYMKQKNKRNLIVTGLYPNETNRKRSGTRAPLRGYAEITDQAAAFLYVKFFLRDNAHVKQFLEFLSSSAAEDC